MNERFVIIAMDGQGNVDFRDGQEFASKEIAQRVADGLNTDPDHDWFYMPTPASVTGNRELRK